MRFRLLPCWWLTEPRRSGLQGLEACWQPEPAVRRWGTFPKLILRDRQSGRGRASPLAGSENSFENVDDDLQQRLFRLRLWAWNVRRRRDWLIGYWLECHLTRRGLHVGNA